MTADRSRRVGLAAAAAAGVAASSAGLIAWQARRLRRHPLLPGHPGFYVYETVAPPGRPAASGPVLDLLVFGDSTAAGVGVDRAADSLPVRLAENVAVDRDAAVRVLSYGWSGARASDVAGDQLRRARGPLRPHVPGSRPPLPDADLVAVVVGANDVIHGTPPGRFRVAMTAILDGIRDTAPNAEIVVAGIPRFRGALAQYEPLIAIGDLYGGVLRRLQRRVARDAGAAYADLARDVMGRLDPRTAALAADAFHPGPEIYRVWAAVIAEALEGARRPAGASEDPLRG